MPMVRNLLLPLVHRRCQSPTTRRLLSATTWLLGSTFVAMTLSVIKAFLLARLLGAEGYGLLGLIMAYPALVGQCLDVRSHEAVIHFASRFLQLNQPQKALATIKLCLVIELSVRLVGFLAISLSVWWTAVWFTKSTANAPLMAFYGLIVLAAVPRGVCSGVLRISNRYAQYSQADVVGALLELVGSAAILFLGGGLKPLLELYVATACLRSVWLMVAARPALIQLGLPSWRQGTIAALKGERREVLRFLLCTGLMGGLKGIHTHVDVLLVGCFLGPAPTGHFRLAKQIIKLFAIPQNPISLLALPELTRIWHDRGERALRKTVWWLAGVSALLTGAVAALLVLMGPWLIELAAGKQYAGAWPTVQIMLLGVALIMAAQFAYAGLIGMGRPALASHAFSAAVLAQTATLIVALPHLGIVGAAWAFVAFAAVRSLLFFYFFHSSITPVSLGLRNEAVAP